MGSNSIFQIMRAGFAPDGTAGERGSSDEGHPARIAVNPDANCGQSEDSAKPGKALSAPHSALAGMLDSINHHAKQQTPPAAPAAIPSDYKPAEKQPLPGLSVEQAGIATAIAAGANARYAGTDRQEEAAGSLSPAAAIAAAGDAHRQAKGRVWR